ncbi:MAG: YlxR family protein [Clostridia bacterium]
MSKPVQRMCIVCRQMKDKAQLIRVVAVDGNLQVDKTYKHNGRGAYICKDIACYNKCIKSRALNRQFQSVTVSAEFIAELEKQIES